MKFWMAEYDWHGGYGAYEEMRYAVVAETKEVALGLCLEAEKETSAELWTITEINSEAAGAHYVSSRCS